MDRLTQLREYMEKERLDAFYIAKPANVRCISGFTGEDSFLFITKANQYFITDARYTEQASYECPDYELVNWRINFGYSMGKAVAYCADKDGVKTIGFEQDHLTCEKWNSMQAELGAEMVPTLNVIEGFRAIKTPEEIKRYQKIISNKEAILADAQNKADAIIAQAQIQTNELVSEHQIMQQAYAKANEIIMLATKNAQDMLDKATEDANSIRMGAIAYTDDMLNTIESVISNSMETTQARTETFMQTMQGYLDIVVANRQELAPQEVKEPEAPADQPQTPEPKAEETASEDNVPALDIPESFFNKE